MELDKFEVQNSVLDNTDDLVEVHNLLTSVESPSPKLRRGNTILEAPTASKGGGNGQNFIFIWGCKPSAGVEAETKMVEELT